MPRDPKVLPFKKKDKPADLAEALLVPPPLEPDAGEPLPSGNKLYGQVPLEWLLDPAYWHELSPAMRLHLYIQIKSRRGARKIRLTNEMAVEIGLSRLAKHRALRRAEARGDVLVERRGRQFPLVSVPRRR